MRPAAPGDVARARGGPAWRALLVPALVLLAYLPPPARAATVILDDGTESPTTGMIRPPPPLVRLFLGTFDDANDRRQIDDCLKEDKLQRGDDAALLRAVRVPAGGGRVLWYVRGATDPYCQAFYGAHVYHYDLIEKRPGASPYFRILFDNDGDRFTIFPQRHHGLNDV